MNALTLLRYLFGHAGAIRKVASSPMAVPVGLLLVFSAAVARNYDQEWFGGPPTWLLPPLVVSVISGFWLLLFVSRAWAEEPLRESLHVGGFWGITCSFFGLFWMTAPIAWLYAIPLERYCDPLTAARGNVWLLAVVSVWRVLLMSRVVSVISGWSFARCFGLVLLPASLEAVVFSIAGDSIGQRLMKSMGGLRNSPAEDVMFAAYNVAANIALCALLATLVIRGLFAIWKKPPPSTWAPEIDLKPSRGPWIFLALVAGLWACACVVPQSELKLTHEATLLAKKKDWPGLMTFLSKHRREDFAPAVTLPPSPWEFHTQRDVPQALRHVTPESPAWVQEVYLGYMEALISQERWYYSQGGYEDTSWLIPAVENLRGGREMLQRCKWKLKDAMAEPRRNIADSREPTALMSEVLNYAAP